MEKSIGKIGRKFTITRQPRLPAHILMQLIDMGKYFGTFGAVLCINNKLYWKIYE